MCQDKAMNQLIEYSQNQSSTIQGKLTKVQTQKESILDKTQRIQKQIKAIKTTGGGRKQNKGSPYIPVSCDLNACEDSLQSHLHSLKDCQNRVKI